MSSTCVSCNLGQDLVQDAPLVTSWVLPMGRGRVNEESQAGVRGLYHKQKAQIAPVRESDTEAPRKDKEASEM